MPKRAPTRPRRPTVTLNLGAEHLSALDDLVHHYQAFAEQIPEYRYKRVTRSTMVRVAVLYLYFQDRNGVVGPELLALAKGKPWLKEEIGKGKGKAKKKP